MQRLVSPLIACLLASLASCQYEQGRGSLHHDNQPPANILLHKQALGQDGSFNYAFAADNGLQQGEVINPDGSRKGSYSYVDPNGKTVSLSYTAGKDGFRVLNGDHLPKAPQPQQQQPSPQYYQPQASHYSQPPQQQPPSYPLFRPNPIPYEAYRNSPNAPAYRGQPVPQEEPYRHPLPHPQFRPAPAHYETPYRHPPHASQPLPTPHHRPRPYSVQEGGYDTPSPSPYHPQQFKSDYRQEEPPRPHSFGNGYSFEFAG